MRAWTCIDFPDTHGAFPQSGLDEIAAKYGLGEYRVSLTITGLEGSKQRTRLEARAAAGACDMRRYACPRCQREGRTGFLRPATQEEVARMIEQARAA